MTDERIKPDKKCDNPVVSFRVPAKELAAFDARVAALGMRRSQALRQLMGNCHTAGPAALTAPPVKSRRSKLDRVEEQLRRIGNPLNQAVKRAHEAALRGEAVAPHLDAIAQMRSDLLAVLVELMPDDPSS